MTNAAAQLTIRLFGPPEVQVAGVPLLALHDCKARALLFYLVVTGQSHARDHLAALLWSESPDSNARHSLRTSLYHLRQVLHTQGISESLVGDGDLVYFRLSNEACDIPRFYQLLTLGNESALAEAVSLYRGPFLQGFTLGDAPIFEEWVRYEATRLDHAYLNALQQLASWAESRQSWDEAIGFVQKIIQLDPLAEEVQRQLMGLYVRSGAIGLALRQYRQFETELGRELGVAPSPETQALFQEILGSQRSTRSFAKTSPRLPVRSSQELPLVGRENLLNKLLAESQDALSGRGVTVRLVGEDGIGKSRLLVVTELSQDYANAAAVDFLHHLYDLLAPTASLDEMIRLTYTLGHLHQSLGHLEVAADWHRQNLELALENGNPGASATAHFEMGELALVTNDYLAAISAAESGLAVCLSLEGTLRTTLQARGHRLLGAALAMEGSNLPTAESHLQNAIAAHRLTGNLDDLCATLFELGNVAAQRGELFRALEFYDEAANTASKAHNYYFHALACNNFAYHSLLLGRPEAAQQAIKKAHELAETYELPGALLHIFSTQGEIQLFLGEWAAATESFQYGLTLAEELGNVERQAGYKANLAMAARSQNDCERAIALLEEALMLIIDRGYWHLRTRIRLWLAETLLLHGRIDEAKPYLEAALSTAEEHGRVLLQLWSERLYARLVAAQGNWPDANVLFTHTFERVSRLDFPLEVARTQAAWGEMALLYAPAPHDGYALLAAAREIFAAHEARGELQAMVLSL